MRLQRIKGRPKVAALIKGRSICMHLAANTVDAANRALNWLSFEKASKPCELFGRSNRCTYLENLARAHEAFSAKPMWLQLTFVLQVSHAPGVSVSSYCGHSFTCRCKSSCMIQLMARIPAPPLLQLRFFPVHVAGQTL